MLERAISAMEADQEAALAAFVAGDPEYKENDLYVYCGGPDGNFSAHPSLVGKSLKGLFFFFYNRRTAVPRKNLSVIGQYKNFSS